MTEFDFAEWLDKNAKHMTRFTLNGKTLGIIRDNEKYLLFVDVDDTIIELAEFYDVEAVTVFKAFLSNLAETS